MTNFREYPERPLVGVGGVVIGDSGVLLIRRGNQPRRGEWSVPGGKLEVGETLAEGVRRELREETGLEVEVGGLIEAFDRIYRDPDGRVRFHYVILDYLCRASSAQPAAGGDALEAVWVAEDELDCYGLEENVLRVLRKAFAMSRQSR